MSPNTWNKPPVPGRQKAMLENRILHEEDDAASKTHASTPYVGPFTPEAFEEEDVTWKDLLPSVSFPKLSLPKIPLPDIRIEISPPKVKPDTVANLKQVQQTLRNSWQAGMRESLVDKNMKNWASSLKHLAKNDPKKAPPLPSMENIQGLDDIFPAQVQQITAADVGMTKPSAPASAIPDNAPSTARPAPSAPKLAPHMMMMLQMLLGGDSSKADTVTPNAAGNINLANATGLAAEILQKSFDDELREARALEARAKGLPEGLPTLFPQRSRMSPPKPAQRPIAQAPKPAAPAASQPIVPPAAQPAPQRPATPAQTQTPVRPTSPVAAPATNQARPQEAPQAPIRPTLSPAQPVQQVPMPTMQPPRPSAQPAPTAVTPAKPVARITAPAAPQARPQVIQEAMPAIQPQAKPQAQQLTPSQAIPKAPVPVAAALPKAVPSPQPVVPAMIRPEELSPPPVEKRMTAAEQLLVLIDEADRKREQIEQPFENALLPEDLHLDEWQILDELQLAEQEHRQALELQLPEMLETTEVIAEVMPPLNQSSTQIVQEIQAVVQVQRPFEQAPQTIMQVFQPIGQALQPLSPISLEELLPPNEPIQTEPEAPAALAASAPKANPKAFRPVQMDATETANDYTFQAMLSNNRILNNSIASLAEVYFANAAREDAEKSAES